MLILRVKITYQFPIPMSDFESISKNKFKNLRIKHLDPHSCPLKFSDNPLESHSRSIAFLDLNFHEFGKIRTSLHNTSK